jgi:hypothetical protein
MDGGCASGALPRGIVSPCHGWQRRAFDYGGMQRVTAGQEKSPSDGARALDQTVNDLTVRD